MLTNPTFSQTELATLPIPDFRKTDPAILAKAYNNMKKTQINPWKGAENDTSRDILDKAAAQSARVSIQKIRELRKKISLEPTITNEQSKIA